MTGETRKDRITNRDIRDNVWVTPLEDKTRENCLRWFGHVYRRLGLTVMRRSINGQNH